MGSFKLGKMTFGGLFKKPETTLYPFEKKTPPEGLKGTILINVENCILCGICQRTCPCFAIVVDKPERTWTINHYQCIQCGSCVRECPKKCLIMDPAQPPVTTSFAPSQFVVPEKEKPKKNETDEGAVEIEIKPTGDAEMDAKLAKLPPEKAVKVRAAFIAKVAKEPTGDPDMDAKLADMDPEKAYKLRKAFMAKKEKETI